MKTKAEADFEQAVDECITRTNKLTDELLGMIGERDRKIMTLELELREERELVKAWKAAYDKARGKE